MTLEYLVDGRMDLGLTGKVTLVTAASRGIGLAVAERLAAEGATTATLARTLPEEIESQGAGGGTITRYTADLSDVSATLNVVEAILAEHGRLDILVLNTPGPKITSFLETRLEDWPTAYETLVRPCVDIAHAVAPHMVEQREGSIIFITSTWVKQPVTGGLFSATMRSVLSSLSKQLSVELAPHGVRVNQVQPGATGTGRMQAIVEAKAKAAGTSNDIELSKITDAIPLGRWAEPGEIADAVAFIASPRAAFITGTTLQVDGGATRGTL